jgi:hypothetical protein
MQHNPQHNPALLQVFRRETTGAHLWLEAILKPLEDADICAACGADLSVTAGQ